MITSVNDVKSAARRRYIFPDYANRWDDAAITAAIESAQQEIEDTTHYVFYEKDFTETLSGYDIHGGITLLLSHSPIISISSLTIDGTPKNGEDDEGTTDYYITEANIGRLNFESQLPHEGWNNVTITGKYGMNPAHPTAKQLCEDMVVYQMLMNRETPPHLKDIIYSSSSTNNATFKSDSNIKEVELAFNIKNKLLQLPRKHIAGILKG